MRLLYGSVAVDDCKWLSLGEPPGTAQKLFQFGSDTAIPVSVQGKRLRAGNKPLEGKLVVESNGGDCHRHRQGARCRSSRTRTACWPGPAARGRSPRRPRPTPKEAAALFEKGAVAEWYKDNGWTYPVQGPAASGLGAVQQFFEALGLTPPPKVEISERRSTCAATPARPLRQPARGQTQEKRPVYAHATSDQPWLEVGKAQLNGRVATHPADGLNVPDQPGETLTAKLTVTANGNQKFVIPVTLAVGGARFDFDGATPTGGAVGRRGRLRRLPRRSDIVAGSGPRPAAAYRGHARRYSCCSGRWAAWPAETCRVMTGRWPAGRAAPDRMAPSPRGIGSHRDPRPIDRCRGSS